MVVLDLIGLVSGVLSIVSFVQSLIPEAPTPEDPEGPEQFGTKLRIYVGINGKAPPEGGDSLNGADGMIMQVAHYDNAGDFLTSVDAAASFGSGEFQDLEGFTTETKQAARTVVYGTPANVCIATMGVTLTARRLAGLATGARFAISQVTTAASSVPYCTWLSWTGETSTPAHKFDIEWAPFRVAAGDTGAVPTEEQAQQFCGQAFKAFNVDESVDGRQILSPGNENPGKRSIISGRSDDRIVISSRSRQNASTI